jgi:hypothetical protein
LNAFVAAAAGTLVLHLAWILWVIFGALITRGRLFLTLFHIASLAWGIIVELGPWPCPLTLAEQYFEYHGGVQPYSGGFLFHCLDATVYPDLPVTLLVITGVAVCMANLGIYAGRAWKWHRTKQRP